MGPPSRRPPPSRPSAPGLPRVGLEALLASPPRAPSSSFFWEIPNSFRPRSRRPRFLIACRAVRRSSGHLSLFKLALVLVGVVAAIAVTGASGADFDNDNGPCPGTSDNKILSRCPTAFVGVKYEVQLLSEEDSGCVPYDWFEIPNGSLPPGLTMTRDGLISGVPTSAGFFRFWVWDHDFTAAEGGPDWCQFEDRSEREFSIFVDPGLAIDNETVKGATIGQAYSQSLTAKQVVTLNPRTGDSARATWSAAVGGASSRHHPLGVWCIDRDTHVRGELPVRRQSPERQFVRHEDVHALRPTAREREVPIRVGAFGRSPKSGFASGRPSPRRAAAAPMRGRSRPVRCHLALHSTRAKARSAELLKRQGTSRFPSPRQTVRGASRPRRLR